MKFTIYNLRFTPRSSGSESAQTSSRHYHSMFDVRCSMFDVARPIESPTESKPLQRSSAFTLIEMLAVIAIIGIIAALSVPVIKNFGQSNVGASASRQLLDDIGRARQLAMADRTTVYMVFVPTNFWNNFAKPADQPAWMTALQNSGQLGNISNLFDKQLAGYTYLAYGALGDQPGRHTWHYLAPWQSLPEGSFIPTWKFSYAGTVGQPLGFSDPANPTYSFNKIYPFSYTNTFPFPTTNVIAGFPSGTPAAWPLLPYIAFNYLGQLSDYSGNMLSSSDSPGQDYDLDFAGGGVDIPLAQGSVIPGKDPTTKTPIMGTPGVNEMPPGNSTNISYTVVHIDPLTGRATLEYHKMQ
ncbi:MAG TPA: prepilin-type N-terminal cleavage/methylation domain-containing protein [Verrucomicrobiae bacterium]|nr:prepilin-type N-terminal cleavage/methylation domain-containing protein [Verrucomicrobiae bacterium]